MFLINVPWMLTSRQPQPGLEWLCLGDKESGCPPSTSGCWGSGWEKLGCRLTGCLVIQKEEIGSSWQLHGKAKLDKILQHCNPFSLGLTHLLPSPPYPPAPTAPIPHVPLKKAVSGHWGESLLWFVSFRFLPLCPCFSPFSQLVMCAGHPVLKNLPASSFRD